MNSVSFRLSKISLINSGGKSGLSLMALSSFAVIPHQN
jgi:hypothetical protein